MRTIDLSKQRCSLGELLSLAQSESILIRSASGGDFVLEPADEFDREVAALGASERFMAFLESRARQSERIPLDEVRRKHGTAP